MTLLQTQSSTQASFFESSGQQFDLKCLFGIFKKRLLSFAVPYLLVLLCGSVAIAFLRPIYRSEGKILVESPEIPPDLVRPTVTEVAYERVQVIQQRIMARDNLMAVINKYNLFRRERDSISGSELLDLIRSRTEMKPIDLSAQAPTRPANPTIAFTLSFEYEDQTLAMKVANELLTSILREDASARNKDAAGTTQFLEYEVKRLQSEHDAVINQMVTHQKERPRARSTAHPHDKTPVEPEELKQKKKLLVALETDWAQKSAIYSDEHPILKNLKRNIASLRRQIALTPKLPALPEPQAPEERADDDLQLAPDHGLPNDPDALVLMRQEANLQKSLEEATGKLTAARLGETMERNQKGERLQVIEQPTLPQKPVWPNKLRFWAGAFGLAIIAGAATVFLAESLDDTIRGSRELSAVVDRDLLVTIPYMPSPREDRRARSRVIAICLSMLIVSAATLGVTAMTSSSLDFSSLSRSGSKP